MELIGHETEERLIVDALVHKEEKVKVNGVEVFLSKYPFKRTDGYNNARIIAKQIIKTLYEPVTKITKKPPKKTVKKLSVGKVINGVRYIV